jgi:uncharacterized membrane protein YfcA
MLVTNVWQMATTRRGVGEQAALGFLAPFLAAGAVGIAAGTMLLVRLDETTLSVGLAAMLIAYVALRLGRPHLRIGARAGRIAAFPVGLVAGALQGATGVAGPIAVTFIHAMRFERATHLFAISALFLLFAAAQLSALALAGVFTAETLWEGLVALPPVIVAMPAGQYLAMRFSHATFDRVILALLGLSAIKMLVGAIVG